MTTLTERIAATLIEHTIARGEPRGWTCRCGFEGDPTPDAIAAHKADMLAPLVAAEQARAVEDVAKGDLAARVTAIGAELKEWTDALVAATKERDEQIAKAFDEIRNALQVRDEQIVKTFRAHGQQYRRAHVAALHEGSET